MLAGELFLDKSKMTDLWSQVGVPFVLRSKGMEMALSEVSFTFESGANERTPRSA